MIAFMTIIYVVVVVLVFKVLKVKPRPWPIAITITVGVLMLGTIIVLWTIAAPLSPRCVVTRYVVQIVPQVAGQVISIPAKPNAPIKKGAVLYQIDPTTFQSQVDQAKAQLHAAKSSVLAAEAGVELSEANVKKTEAEMTAKKADYDVAVKINEENPQAISRLKLVEAEQNYAAAQATLAQVTASEAQARASALAAKDNVAAVEAGLAIAEQNLNECTVTAPSDGFITNWEIREGTYVVPMPLAAAGTFIDTSETSIVASYSEQMLMHVRPGQKVELAFKSNPGQLFLGKVEEVIQASGEGQFAPGGKLPSAASIGSPGFLAVKIRLDDAKWADELAMGTAGVAAIYTGWGKPFAPISKVAIRMKKWLYYLPLP